MKPFERMGRNSLFVWLVANAVICLGNGVDVDFLFHPEKLKLRSATRANTTISLTPSTQLHNVTLYFDSSDTTVMVVETKSLALGNLSRGQEVNGTIWVKGLNLGHSFLKVRLSSAEGTNQTAYAVDVLRTETGQKLSLGFTSVMIGLTVLNSFLMATQLDLNSIKDCLKKPMAPIIGFCCQHILMPLTSFCWGLALLRDYPSLFLGYFAIGCSPGDAKSKAWSKDLGANPELSVTLRFISNAASVLLMPFWLLTLGQYFSPSLTIPFVDIVKTLAVLVVPAGAGLALRHWRAKSIKSLRIVAKYSIITIIVIFFVFGYFSANRYIFGYFRWYTIIAALLLPYMGYFLSYLIAWALRQDSKNRITISIETGIQNGVIAILLMRFSQEEPDSEITLVMPLIVMMFTGIPFWIAYFGKLIRRKCCSKKETEVAPEPEQNNTTRLVPSTQNPNYSGSLQK